MSGYQPTPEAVVAARRRLARESFADFCCLTDIPTAPVTDADDEDRFGVMRIDRLAAHHALICRELQDVADGLTPNLMLLLPPGTAKSTYADVMFAPWFMARFPRRNVILASYAANIARKQGRRARQLIKSKSFANLNPDVGLNKSSTAADEWALSNGSEFMAGGLLGGLTGNRAALGILDDPIAGRDEAESQTIRNKTWDAYVDDFCSRLIPGAPQVMILTRWHQDDPAGRILPKDWDGQSGWFDGRDGRRWKVLCLPAICDRADDPLGRKIGESIWPEWFGRATGDPLDHWRPFMTNSRTWTSLYQQRPAPDKGSYFGRDDFNRYAPKDMPRSLNYYGTSDYAVTDGGGDFTVLRIWGIDEHGDLWLMPGGYKAQASSDKWIAAQVALIKKYQPLAWFGEAGVIQKAIEPALIQAMRKADAYTQLVWLPSITNKAARARGFQARVATGAVWVPEGSVGDAIIDEYTRFPAGAHDDDVDNGGLMGRALDEAHPAIAIVRPQPKTPGDRWATDDSDDSRDWKTA